MSALGWVLAALGRGTDVYLFLVGMMALAAYAQRFAGLCEELRAFAKRFGAVYVRVRTDEPLEAAVRRLVARSVD